MATVGFGRPAFVARLKLANQTFSNGSYTEFVRFMHTPIEGFDPGSE